MDKKIKLFQITGLELIENYRHINAENLVSIKKVIPIGRITKVHKNYTNCKRVASASVNIVLSQSELMPEP